MDILLYVGIAYVLCGISLVLNDVSGRPIDRPSWAILPTLQKALGVGLLWFVRPTLDASSFGISTRAVAFGAFGALVQLMVTTALVWACAAISGMISEASIVRVLLSSVFLVVAMLFVMPILKIPLMLITTVIAIPLDLLFPDHRQRERDEYVKWPTPTTALARVSRRIDWKDANRVYKSDISLPGLAKASVVIVLGEAVDLGRKLTSSAELRPILADSKPDVVLFELCAYLQLFPNYHWFYDYSSKSDLDSEFVGEMLTAFDQIASVLFRLLAGFDASDRTFEYSGDDPEHAALILAKALIASKGRSSPVGDTGNIEIEEVRIRAVAEAMKPELLTAGRRVSNAIKALANEHERQREENEEENFSKMDSKMDSRMTSIAELDPEEAGSALLKVLAQDT